VDQLTARDLVLVGLATQTVLALLFALVWRSLRGGWPAWLALGFAANAATYGAMAAGLFSESLFVEPARLVALLSVAGVVLITLGVVDYVGVERRLARRLNTIAVVAALLAIALGLLGVINRALGHGVLAAYVVGWAWLFVRAMSREPHSGHGFVVLALLVYPVSVLAIITGRLPPQLLGASAVLPFSVLGATLLTTGLLRAQRRAALALAEREQAQALLRAAHDSLEHQVMLRTAELRENIDGLESFNRSVSHDLRGPLGGIVGITRLARDHLAAGDHKQAQHLLDLIEDQAISSVKLVEALLALSRASDATLHRREVDCGQLVAEVIKALPTEAAACCTLAAPMPRVHCDPELMRQVFTNLIGNALKFSGHSQRPQVEVTTLVRDGETVFLVRDNGVGFDPAAAQRLFKPFQRLHDRSYEGVGVGLSIVKRIIDRHGGRVWAEGRPEQGASFYFTLGPDAADRR
jgi:signal transduction histidine kinase